MTEEKDSVKRMLEAKTRQPEYQKLDIEPKIGGQSLLHDEFGMPKVGNENRRNIPTSREISSDPVIIKASVSNSKPTFRKQVVNKVVDDDDKFIPPKNNFVSVGNVEHSWHDEKVTGIIDNNEEVDIEKLQGVNTKIGESIKFFTKRLQHVKSLVVAELAEITDLQELKNLRENTFGPKGIFTDIVKQLDTLKDKIVIGELVNNMYSELDLEISGKEFELTSEAEEDSKVTEWPEEMAQIVRPSSDDDDDDEMHHEVEDDGDQEDAADPSAHPAIPEGHYAVILDGKLINIEEDAGIVRDFISDLLLNKNLELNRIQLIKRIKIDFGIILGE